MPRVLLLPLLAIALGVSGCGSDDRPVTDLAGPSLHAREHREPRHGGTAPPHRTHPATPGRPAGSRTTRPKSAPLLPLRRASVDDHLLGAGRMPLLADGLAWVVVDDDPDDTQPVGACQKTSLASIGALGAVRRTYAAGPEDPTDGTGAVRAVQVVARFADDKSAWRAHEVLRSWREDCQERLDFPRKEVGPLETVDVRVGTGDNYRTVYGPRSVRRGTTAGLGIVRSGSYLSVVEITTGVDDYPEGRDPARVAVRRIARTFD